MELSVSGPELRRAVHRSLADVARQGGQDTRDFTEDRIERAERWQRVDLITDPKTLRPYSVESSVTVTVKLKGEGDARRETETKRFLFDWEER